MKKFIISAVAAGAVVGGMSIVNNLKADVCSITDATISLSELATYPAPCDQSKFTGKFGDPSQTVHMLESDRQNQLAALVAKANSDKAASDARLARIKAACPSQPQGTLLRDLCDQIAGN